MSRKVKVGLSVAVALLMAGGIATAQNRDEHDDHGGGHPGPAAAHAAPAQHAAPKGHAARPAAPRGEPHPGPSNYKRVGEPEGWNKRPAAANRETYRHNFQAARSFRIGPYHRPKGWVSHHWGYGQILPRVYWSPEYHIADYWLFALEVPPLGAEWVRDDDDAILVDVDTGEILQVEYGVFA